MDVLKRMSVIWPSAFRALELLTGAKASLNRPSDVSSVRSSFSETRNKRAAEDPIDPEDVTITDRSRVVADSQVSRQHPSYSVVPGQNQGQGQPSHVSGHTQDGYTLSIDVSQSSAPSTYMQSSYDRWPTDNSSSLSNFSGSISTSVLPQQYSTGLVDERMGASVNRSSERQSQRYPQFWNDYSALGQMETTYSVPVMGEMVPPHGSGQTSSAGHQQSMYVSDQYSMFGEWLSQMPSCACGLYADRPWSQEICLRRISSERYCWSPSGGNVG